MKLLLIPFIVFCLGDSVKPTPQTQTYPYQNIDPGISPFYRMDPCELGKWLLQSTDTIIDSGMSPEFRQFADSIFELYPYGLQQKEDGHIIIKNE